MGTWDRKGGVGLIVVLDDTAELDEITVDSPANAWAAEIYVAAAPAADLDGWGPPVASRDDIPSGAASFVLDGARGRAVLVWFTDLGDFTNPNALRLHVNEVTVRGS